MDTAPTPVFPIAATPPRREDLARLPTSELALRLKVGVENFDPRTLKLTDALLDCEFAPEQEVGRWSCRVLLGHLADAELSFVHRMRRVVAEDGPVLAAWDENAFIDAGLYGGGSGGAAGQMFPIGAFIATIHTLRQWTGPWLATLRPAAWSRTALHPQRGEQSLRTIVEYDVWHLEHHAWYLNRKVALLLRP